MLKYEELAEALSPAGSLTRDTLKPATVGSVVCRVARNIVNSINRRPTNGLELPWFAALSALTILESDYYLYGRLCDFIRTTPSLCDTDIDILEHACMYPAIDQHEDHLKFCELARYYDRVGRNPKKRTSDDASVRFKVGQIFKHRLFQFYVPIELC